MNPLLSIIIPFYGTANRTHLDACIDSIRRQPVETNRYEIIIADDGGKGLGAARNAGMAKAHGTYVLFVDADDILFPNTLSHCLDFLLMYEPDMLSFGYSYLRSQQETLPEQHPFNTEIYISGAEYMAKHNFLGTAWRHIFLREWLNRNNLRFAEEVYHEDEAFVAKAYFMAGTTVVTDLVVYGYVHNASSILNSDESGKRQKRMNDFLNQLIELKVFMDKEEELVPALQFKALRRRISFLTIDFMIQLRRNKCGITCWHKYLRLLKKHALLPLPDGHYSSKYTLARSVINPISFFL